MYAQSFAINRLTVVASVVRDRFTRLFYLQVLYPAFCAHNALDEDRPPSACTCVNLLKLPPLKDDKMMRNRVLYAIWSGARFEFS